MGKEFIKVSVVVPNYNSASTVGRCIQSIINSDYKRIEVIIIDDCSKDSSWRIIKDFKDRRIKAISNKTNSGPSKTRNKGIKLSKGDIILLIDSDTLISPELIRQHASAHKDRDVDAIAGSIQGVHETIAGQADDFSNWWTSIPGSKDKFITKLHVPATNLSIKKSVFKRVGYFKEGLRYGEDSEFSNRMIKNGLKIYFKSGIKANHFDRDSLKGFIMHNYKWGASLIENRVKNGLEYGWLLPKSYFASWLYMIPLSVLFTTFIVYKWLFFKPKVILYSPLLFLGKFAETVGVKDSLREK